MRPESSQPVRPGRGSASTPAARPNSRCHSTRWCWRSGSGRVRATASWPGSHVSWVFTRRRLLADRPISRYRMRLAATPASGSASSPDTPRSRPAGPARVRTTGRGRTTRSPARARPGFRGRATAANTTYARPSAANTGPRAATGQKPGALPRPGPRPVAAVAAPYRRGHASARGRRSLRRPNRQSRS